VMDIKRHSPGGCGVMDIKRHSPGGCGVMDIKRHPLQCNGGWT